MVTTAQRERGLRIEFGARGMNGVGVCGGGEAPQLLGEADRRSTHHRGYQGL